MCAAVDADLLSAVLVAFAEQVGAGEGKLVILVLNNAGWHGSGDLVVPKGSELAFLPAYTPELQPAEHSWPLANKHFATLKDLDAALSERCCTLGRHARRHQGRDPPLLVAGRHPGQRGRELISRSWYWAL